MPRRSAVVPGAPTTGISCFASDAPTWNDSMAATRPATAKNEREGIMRGDAGERCSGLLARLADRSDAGFSLQNDIRGVERGASHVYTLASHQSSGNRFRGEHYMKMRVIMALAISLSVAACAQQPSAQQGGGEGSAAPAEKPAAAAAPAGGGLAGSPEQQAKQAELEKNTPQ